VFSETKQVEVQLDEVHVKFDAHKDEAYNLNFNIITFQKMFESSTSTTKLSKTAPQEPDTSFVNWIFDQKKRVLHLGKNEDEDQKERDEAQKKRKKIDENH